MNKLSYFIITTSLLIAGCKSEVENAECTRLKAELAECKKTVEELQNTPQARLLNVQQYLSKNDFASAKKESDALNEKFSETDEAEKAKSLIDSFQGQQMEKGKADERKKALGFKILKENTSVKVGEVTIKFGSVTSGQQWVFDDYGTESRYRSAERGEKYVLAKVSVSSESKEPKLPPVGVYEMVNGTLSYIGTMDYEFSRWDDYGSYLGNYTDFKNDFAHTKTIPFSLGQAVKVESLSNNAVFVVVKKENCVFRSSERFKRPPVSYTSGCDLKSNLTVDDFDKEYVLVHIFNKGKL